MPETLKFTVVNATRGNVETKMLIQDREATVSQYGTLLDATPTGIGGKTFSAVLPPEALDEFPEGTKIKLTIEVDDDPDVATPVTTTSQES